MRQAARVTLASGVGGSGQNFANTTFDDTAANSINIGSAPFTGSFQPSSPLSLLNGTAPNGNWSLECYNLGTRTGTLTSWSITVTTSTAEPRTTSNSTGNYGFDFLAAGTYSVREIGQAGYGQTSPAGGFYSVSYASGQSVTGRDFGNSNSSVSAAPLAPVLAGGSDTGVSSSDGITRLNNSAAGSSLQFTVGGTVTGAAVTLYADGNAIGSATATGTSTVITTNGASTLADGAHLITARQAAAGKGLSAASAGASVTIDATPPTLAWGGASPAPNAAGWNHTNVSLPFTASDAISGVASTSSASPIVLSAEGSAVTGSVTVTDIAGNSATFVSAPFKIDKTPPTLAWSAASPAPNAAGWNNTNVSLPFTAGDALSGISGTSSVSPLVLSAEGSAVTGSVTVTDIAGNSATFNSSSFKIDKTPPTLTWGTASPAPNAAGWNNTNVSLPFTAGDGLSGIASSSSVSPLVLSAEGSAITGSVTVTDIAGNSATFNSSSFKIDKTPPTLTWGTASPAPNAAGWNNTNVSLPFTASDGISGIASSSSVSPLVLSAEGSAITGNVTVTDMAGNSATFNSSSFKIDKTPPTLTWGTASPTPNAAGWNNTNVSLPFTLSDALSGLASSSPGSPILLSTEGSAVTGSVSATDVAGNNVAFTSAPYKIDKTPPTAGIAAVTPTVRDTAVDQMSIIFSEPVVSLGLGNLALTCNGGPDLLTASQTLSSADNITWTLGGLTALTGSPGLYQLALAASGGIFGGSSVTDIAGNPLATGASAGFEVYPGQGVSAGDTFTISSSPADPANAVVQRNAESPYTIQTPLSNIPSLSFAGLAGNNTFIVDLSGANPVPAGGLSFDGGSGTGNSLQVIGSASAANHYTVTASQVTSDGGSLSYTNIQSMEIDGGAAADSLTIAQPLSFSPVFRGGADPSVTDTLYVHAGTYNFAGDARDTTASLALVVGDASSSTPAAVNFASTEHLASLQLLGPASAVLLPHGTGPKRYVFASDIQIGPAATLDLADNDLIIQATAATRQALYDAIASAIGSARNGGPLWGGVGITSSAARNNADGTTGLGAIINQTDPGGPALWTTFDGESVTSDAILVKYTWNGDTNLDGTIDAIDYQQIDMGYRLKAAGYANGDFDYSGAITQADYVLIDQAFIHQNSVL